jgi:class 3 adenylate cyclase
MNAANTTALPTAFLEAVVPFFLLWDAAGTLVHASAPLLRYLDVPTPLDAAALRLVRPFEAVLDPRQFDDVTDMVLVVRHAAAPTREMRGEIRAVGDGRWMFACVPPIATVSDLTSLGLTFSDLPLHFGLGDALIANEAAQVALSESRQSLEDLRVANAAMAHLNDVFGRFVPRPFLDALGVSSPAHAQLGARASAAATVMFADLRNFTTLSERMEPNEIFAFINSYLAHVAPRIRDNKGFVVHYLGDGILALFEGEPDLAVRAAVQMQDALREAVASGLLARLPEGIDVRIGVGLHFGHLELGIVGESGRWDSSIISDAVNTASRVENLTKELGADVLLSGTLRDQLAHPEALTLRRLGLVKVKGRSEQVDVYEVLDAVPADLRAPLVAMRERFEAAVVAHERGDNVAAIQEFRACLAHAPHDRASRRQLARLGIDG